MNAFFTLLGGIMIGSAGIYLMLGNTLNNPQQPELQTVDSSSAPKFSEDMNEKISICNIKTKASLESGDFNEMLYGIRQKNDCLTDIILNTAPRVLAADGSKIFVDYFPQLQESYTQIFTTLYTKKASCYPSSCGRDKVLFAEGDYSELLLEILNELDTPLGSE
jgi:hypothetical protein